jgi:hypothetical protein
MLACMTSDFLFCEGLSRCGQKLISFACAYFSKAQGFIGSIDFFARPQSREASDLNDQNVLDTCNLSSLQIRTLAMITYYVTMISVAPSVFC